MICPECKKQQLKSTVIPMGSSSTLVCYIPFYDEEGKYHNHDANKVRSSYKCSNGHIWDEVSHGTCWCGWPTMENIRNNICKQKLVK
jgi:hypothetical protein